MIAEAKRPNWVLDVLIVAAHGAFLVLGLRYGAQVGHPIVKGPAAVVGGFDAIYVGLLFLLSYFLPDATYILNFMRYLCEGCSNPVGRHMAFFYFVLGLAVGIWLLAVGLGMVEP